jgi:hypothetical protein
MNEVTLVKVTLNEATDPDLYAYIMRYDNPRVRAGAIRALARAALVGDRSHAPMESVHAVEQPRLSKPRAAVQPGDRETHADAAASDLELSPAADLVDTHEAVTALSHEADGAGNGRRFDSDAIADQFAQF